MNPKISLRPEILDFGPRGQVFSIVHQDREEILDEFFENHLKPKFRITEFGNWDDTIHITSLVEKKPSFWSRIKAWFHRWCRVPQEPDEP